MTSTAAASVSTCPDCATPLTAGACPACALRQLLSGSGSLEFEEDFEGEAEGRAAEPEEVEFGRYTLKRRLAAGGMGVVYLAEDRKLKRTVALKMIRGSMFANEPELARFTIEAEAAAALDHPHIVPIFEVGRLSGQPYYTMKFIEGDCLAGRLKKSGGAMPPRETAALLSKIARAAHHAHQRGVLHRDLKPGNILIDRAGEPWLTDFGLAKLAGADSSLTLTTDHLGTPHYMSPEVADGRNRQVSTAIDVWALGVILWELLSGKPPFHGPGSVEIMRRIVEHDPVWPQGKRREEDLVTIARRCMEKDPARRPESASVVADELDRWLRGEPIQARPVTRGERFVKWVKRKPALAALYGALAAGAVSGLFLWQRAEQAVVSLTETNVLLADALRVSTATKLAGDARLQVEESPARALLLAVESVEMTEQTATGVLPEAASALTAVLQKVSGFDASVFGVKDRYDDSFPVAGWWMKNCTQVSPDSRWLLCLDFQSYKHEGVTAALFDLRDSENTTPVRRWMLWPGPVSTPPALCWLPDSRRLLSVTPDGKATVWDVTTDVTAAGPPAAHLWGLLECPGMKVHSISLTRPRGEAQPCGALTWKNAEEQTEEVLVQRVEFSEGAVTAGALRKAGPQYSKQTSLAMSSDGRWLAATGSDRAEIVALFDLHQPGQPPVELAGGPVEAGQLRFTRDCGRLIVRTKKDKSRIFDLNDARAGTPLAGRDLPATPGGTTCMAISPDGQWMAAGCGHGVVSVISLRENVPAVTLHLPAGSGSSAEFSADGKWLACGGDGRVACLWRVDEIHSGAPPLHLRGTPAVILNLEFSPDGRWLMAAGNCGGAIRRWRVDEAGEGAMPQYCPAGSWQVKDVAVSPDSKWIASACAGRKLPGRESEEGFVTLSRADGTQSCVLGSHANAATGVAFSRDGRWLAGTGHDGTVKVWDVAEACRAAMSGGTAPPAPLFTLPMADTRLLFDRQAAFHPRGTLYAVCGDGILFEWDLSLPDPAAAAQVHEVHSIHYLLPDLKISPDGKWMAIARHGWDPPAKDGSQSWNQVLLYDVSRPGPPVPGPRLMAQFVDITRLDFSPDGRWLSAGGAADGPAIWDLKAADIAGSRRIAPVNCQVIAGTSFSPDGRWLALGGNDGLLHLWDWQRPGQLRTFQTGSSISSLAWLADGRLAIAGASSRVAVWDTDIGRQKEIARKLAGRHLSEAERSRFRLTARY